MPSTSTSLLATCQKDAPSRRLSPPRRTSRLSILLKRDEQLRFVYGDVQPVDLEEERASWTLNVARAGS